MATAKKIADMSGLVAVKGHAAPAAPSVPKRAAAAQAEASQAPAAAPQDPAGAGFHRAMTLKLDKNRYTRIKQLGLDEDTTSQALLIEALDMLFAKRAAAQ